MASKSTSPRTVNLAIVQASPCPLDLDASVARAARWIEEAAEKGAQLVVFGETWLSGYPAWIDRWPRLSMWDDPRVKKVHAKMRAEALVIPSAHTSRLGELARTLGVVVVIGATERVESGPGAGTLYNALLVFDTTGDLVIHHRKLRPTHTERLVWGPGDARGLEVAQTSVGRIGGLVCWEHWMPLARQVLHDGAEQIHVAQWPTVNEMHRVATRHYAFEGRCFAIAAGQILRTQDLPNELAGELEGVPEDGLLARGGSCVFGPDGSYIVEPVFDREVIIRTEIDLSRIDEETMTLDVSGHYARPDVFRLAVERRRPGVDDDGGERT